MEESMANTARNVTDREEFWRPPVQESQHRAPAQAEACERCGAEYVAGSRFCHLCGEARQPRLARPRFDLGKYLDWSRIRQAVGMSTSSLLAFVVGIACLLAAILTGVVYTAATVLDWQAVQLWRLEWLLAAIAVFVAGLLLKQSAA
jgi:hypothetical protein